MDAPFVLAFALYLSTALLGIYLGRVSTRVGISKCKNEHIYNWIDYSSIFMYGDSERRKTLLFCTRDEGHTGVHYAKSPVSYALDPVYWD